jgi:hypothetical protein
VCIECIFSNMFRFFDLFMYFKTQIVLQGRALLFTRYIQLFAHLIPTGRGSGRGRAQAEPSPTAWARPQGFESLSRQKPGPSRGFEPKPSPHITIHGIVTWTRVRDRWA